MQPSPISATVDFEKEGVQHGFLKLPYSRDDSAWGAVMIPIAVVRRGQGPTALLTGANHGDEYEGPIALFDLANELDSAQVSGRIIIVPAMNYPAFRAGTRTSPIDKGNLNRVFPGRPGGTVTEKIADYFHRYLLPMADCVLDIHSGGKTLQFVPFAAAHTLPDKALQARCVAAMQAFNAPYSLMLLELDSVGMYDSAAEEMGRSSSRPSSAVAVAPRPQPPASPAVAYAIFSSTRESSQANPTGHLRSRWICRAAIATWRARVRDCSRYASISARPYARAMSSRGSTATSVPAKRPLSIGRSWTASSPVVISPDSSRPVIRSHLSRCPSARAQSGLVMRKEPSTVA